MHDVIGLLSAQIRADLSRLPELLRSSLSEGTAAQRAINIEDLRRLARRRVPRVFFDFIDGAAGDESTAGRNRTDFDDLAILPRVLTGPGEVDLSTEVLGTGLRIPLIGSPTGMTGLIHPEGEVAIARALGQFGGAYTLSTAASRTMSEVADAGTGPKWFQLYMGPDRGLVRELLQDARKWGFSALVVTVDTPRSAVRERDVRNRFAGMRLTTRSLIGGAVRPRWSVNFLRSPHILTPGVLTAAVNGPVAATGGASLVAQQFDPTMTWDDIEWVQEHWDGPIALKGVLRADDADRARRMGLDGVIVSNHGGRQLDHAVSAISALPAVVDAVGDDLDVILDSGIRRGADILRAVALGAKACMTGRSFVYALGAGGEAGVRRAVEILTAELRLAMTFAGAHSLRDLDRTLLRRSARDDEYRLPSAPAVRG